MCIKNVNLMVIVIFKRKKIVYDMCRYRYVMLDISFHKISQCGAHIGVINI